jgi:hypothetical protein
MIDQDQLKKIVNYCPTTGIFYWVRARPNCTPGKIAGRVNKNTGYVRVMVGGVRYKAHRLAFIWMTGKCPEFVDHINRNRSDNRWENLRPATRKENSMNRNADRGSSSKFLGVSWDRANRKWEAQVKPNSYKKINLGRHKHESDAAWAYNLAAYNYFKEFANYNKADQELIFF